MPLGRYYKPQGYKLQPIAAEKVAEIGTGGPVWDQAAGCVDRILLNSNTLWRT
jgi:hypothetical protein